MNAQSRVSVMAIDTICRVDGSPAVGYGMHAPIEIVLGFYVACSAILRNIGPGDGRPGNIAPSNLMGRMTTCASSRIRIVLDESRVVDTPKKFFLLLLMTLTAKHGRIFRVNR